MHSTCSLGRAQTASMTPHTDDAEGKLFLLGWSCFNQMTGKCTSCCDTNKSTILDRHFYDSTLLETSFEAWC